MAKVKRRRRAATAEGFWDRPALLNLAADVLIVFAVLLLAWAATAGIKRLPVYPVRELVVVGTVEHVSRAQIEHAARTTLAGNLLAVNIEDARTVFEKLPWVRRAAVRRQWPDALELTLEEHDAVARWSRPDGETRLVNHHGEVFIASSDEDLPVFSGPEGSAPLMLQRFGEFAAQLAKMQQKPVAVTLSSREAWQIRLADGVLLDLGRDQAKQPLTERLERFARHYADARRRANVPVAAVDMRYPSGFALQIGQPDRKSAS